MIFSIFKLNKTIGSVFIIAGTTLGAGMLALPMVAAGEGILFATLLLLLLWALMLFTGLLILEINLTFPVGASFNTMTKSLLGNYGSILAFASIILLFYALCTAYISGGTQLLVSLFHGNSHHNSMWVFSISFTLIFACIICWKTFAVDCVNRVLFSIKFLFLMFAIIFLIFHLHFNYIISSRHHVIYMWSAIPIMFTAFGFHGSIPSIVKYMDKDRQKLRKIIIIGATIPLIIYLLWLLVTLLMLPLYGDVSFHHVLTSKHSVPMLISDLSASSSSRFVAFAIHLFSDVAITTSFLGVSLGLFDYFYDLFKKLQSSRRLMSGVITFLPPLLITIFYPDIFIYALSFASISLAMLAVILPACMGLSLVKKNNNLNSFGIVFSRYNFIIFLGALIIIIQILSMMNITKSFI